MKMRMSMSMMRVVKRMRAVGYTATMIVAAVVLYVPVAVLFLLGTLVARGPKMADTGMDISVQRNTWSERQQPAVYRKSA